MKKLLAVLLGFSGLVIGLQSCGTCAKCTTNGTVESYCQGEYTNSEIDAAESQCVFNGGSWSD